MEFASATFPPFQHASLALRDHAEQILRAVAADLSTAQTKAEQSEKSKGRAPRLIDAPETAAETHGFLRAKSGFNIEQLVAEYRALRTSVLSRWIEASDEAQSRSRTAFASTSNRPGGGRIGDFFSAQMDAHAPDARDARHDCHAHHDDPEYRDPSIDFNSMESIVAATRPSTAGGTGLVEIRDSTWPTWGGIRLDRRQVAWRAFATGAAAGGAIQDARSNCRCDPAALGWSPLQRSRQPVVTNQV